MGECVCRGAIGIAGFHGDSRNLHFYSPGFYSTEGEAVMEELVLFHLFYQVDIGVEGEVSEGRGFNRPWNLGFQVN